MARRRQKSRTTNRFSNRRGNQIKQSGTLSNHANKTLVGLIGKKVKINRGGPHSKEGILLNVKQDYVALLADKEVLYFAIKHIHSITQNIKEDSSNLNAQTNDEFECSNAGSFSGMLSEYLYQSIHINHGPEARKGILLHFNDAMIVILHEEDGVIFFNMEHVKFIKGISTSDDEGEAKQNNNYSRTDYQKYFGTIHQWNTQYDFQFGSDCFSDLIQTFKHKWVSVNRSGHEALEGILIDEGGGFFTIVNNEEAIRLQSFHIKNISEGAKGSFKTANENDGEESRGGNQSYADRKDCSCEESYFYEDSEDDDVWNSRREVTTYDVFN